MKKALTNLIFIRVDLDREILKYDKIVMSKERLLRLRLLKNIRNDIHEIIVCYSVNTKV